MKQRLMVVALVALQSSATLAAPGTVRGNPEQGGAGYPVIPEPMLFDMVRPLGARRGELEANVLLTKGLNGSPLEWAPEVELAVADGFAVELELPMTGVRVDSFKMGLQGTFGTGFGGNFVHGVQYLGTIDRKSGIWGSSLLYLAGVRYDTHWSSITMIGAKAKDTRQPGQSVLLVNHSLFRDVGKTTTAGLEFNHEGGRDGGWVLLPQVHQRLGRRFVAQMGAGMEKPRGERKVALASLRVIREF
ncbi:hypothetical protein [Sandarakinorhabdus sp.]|uniref:hypothetical protein n=1 Tax=Sandarakinorhabdus sp. TaxID=1916663 RepID=UPI003F6E8BBC